MEEKNMKKIVLIMIALLLVAGLSASIHVNAGLNFNMATIGGGATTNSAAGFQAGASYIMNMGHIMIEPGIRFNMRGFAYGTGDYNFTATYTDIFGRFGYTVSETIPVTAYLGLTTGFLMTAKDGFLEDVVPNYDTRENCNAVNFGLLFGARYLLAKKFSVGFEYDLGLTDIYKDGGLKFYSANILLGYMF